MTWTAAKSGLLRLLQRQAYGRQRRWALSALCGGAWCPAAPVSVLARSCRAFRCKPACWCSRTGCHVFLRSTRCSFAASAGGSILPRAVYVLLRGQRRRRDHSVDSSKYDGLCFCSNKNRACRRGCGLSVRCGNSCMSSVGVLTVLCFVQVHITGKYGVRYGASLRKQIKKIEVSQHAKYTCGCTFPPSLPPKRNQAHPLHTLHWFTHCPSSTQCNERMWTCTGSYSNNFTRHTWLGTVSLTNETWICSSAWRRQSTAGCKCGEIYSDEERQRESTAERNMVWWGKSGGSGKRGGARVWT